ncbi:MAG: mannose-1-phosphate guanylyltransferase [Phycisphaerae bacterium]|nr:mannose-1-phosphate guanylyltransferase [Phycisphaerae bacterium]
MLDECCYAVVMAGGSGTRLWPLSSKSKPKHLLKLFDGKCLIELTIEKLKDHIPDDRILILTSVHYQALAQQTLTHIPPENFIYEPCVRDTASAIGLAATILKQRCDAATMIMLTADQIIEPAAQFNAAITNAASFLESHPDRLIAFGVEAVSANTLVGWQQLGDAVAFPDCEVRKIVEFTEKPDLATAQRYLEGGNHCWNSGQFAWKADTILKEIATHLPQAAPLLKDIGAAWNTTSRDRVLNDLFPQMPKGSIDYKIMQKTDKACSIFLPCSWEDMGTHAALADKIGTKHATNIVSGKAIVTGTGNRVLNHTGQSVVVAHDNLTVVVTDGTVFIGDSNTDMKALIERIASLAPEIL